MRMKKRWFVFLIALLFFSNLITVDAKGTKVIRVGYPIQKGLTEKDENGNYIGYTVEYLNEIKKYTGWEYEFVEADGSLNEQLTTLLQMLKDGEIDLMGGMVYNESLAEIYDYPGYNYGMAYTTLVVQKDNSKWISDDFQNWNGIRVGSYRGLEQREKKLQEFANVNGFTYELVEFDDYATLIKALENGKVDATLQVDISMESNLKSIARFAPVPYYFAATKGSQDLIRELNSALSNITDANAYFQASLYEKYFSSNGEFSISEENREYIKSLGKIKILMIGGNAPIQYEDNGVKGISVSYLENLKQATGLDYEIIVAKDYDDCIKKMQENEIDLVLGVPTNSDLITKLNLTLSLPYLDSHVILVSNKARYESKEDLKNLTYNTEELLKEIVKNKNAVAYLDSYCTNFYLQKKEMYQQITIDITDSDAIQYAIGLVDKDKMYLLSIINSYLSSISDEEKQEITYQNTMTPITYTWIEFIKLYYWRIIAITFVILFFVILSYVRNIKMRSSMLNEIVVQHRRFYELSKLIDECLFEYHYEEDRLRIQNNKLLFDKKNEISNYMSYPKYEFLQQMLQKKEDSTYDFQVDIGDEKKWYRVLLKVIKDEHGVATYALGKIYDVDSEVVEHYALVEKSRRDGLTNLLNRSAAEEYINQCLTTNPEKGILIMFDIDNFKSVNDYKGHPEGDLLLQKISQFIERYFKKEDMKCRLGGDEFLVFLNTTMSIERLADRLETLIKEARNSIFKEYEEYDVSMSVGAAIVTGDETSYEMLYKKVDYAMYVAKLGGKNGFFISDETKCMEHECNHCKKNCRRREYLEKNKK